MKNIILISVTTLLLTACVDNPTINDVPTIIGSCGGVKSDSYKKDRSSINLSRVANNNVAYNYGYRLKRISGSAKSSRHIGMVKSYNKGIKSRLKELELRKKSIEKQGKYSNLSGRLGNNKNFIDIINSLGKTKTDGQLQSIEKEIYLAQKLMIESQEMLQ